ncbi:MAG: hypothetical protein KGV56_00305 [Gammaproteobacteria bacterium]|nr:hypothetical protein [Gammaproteobacteria bacterium]
MTKQQIETVENTFYDVIITMYITVLLHKIGIGVKVAKQQLTRFKRIADSETQSKLQLMKNANNINFIKCLHEIYIGLENIRINNQKIIGV